MNLLAINHIVNRYKKTGTLYLNGLGLRTFPTEFSAYNDVKRLNLSSNLLTDLSFLSHFTKLEGLWLSDNRINNIEVIKQLKELGILYLDNNEIEDISPLLSLQKIQRLSLCNNKITDIPESFFLIDLPIKLESGDSYFNGIYIADNPIYYPPLEIIKQGRSGVNSYINSIRESSMPLNEVKVIFVGDGAAGKTSLLKRLRGKEFNEKESQTHGIRIERDEIKFRDEDIKVNFWDFGGQEIMHATHQFFLTQRCIYILSP